MNWQDREKQTPLIYAIKNKLASTVPILLDFMQCLDKRDNEKRSALWYAIDNCDEDLVQAILKQGIVISRRDRRSSSPIALAIRRGYVKIIQILLHYPDPNSGKTLLEDSNCREHLLSWAIKTDLRDIIFLLLTHGANPNTGLLLDAAERDDEQMIQQLLVCSKTDVNARDNCGRTALSIAAENGHKSIVKALLNCDAISVNAVDINQETALCLAVRGRNKRHADIAQLILTDDRVDVNMANRWGETAIHFAAMEGNIPITAALLDIDDLDPNVLNDQRCAPLTYAARDGKLAMVELFLARADTQVNVQQGTPLYYAAEKGHISVVRRLLSIDDIDIDLKDLDYTPLCLVAARGQLEIVRLLLAHNPRPNINFKSFGRRTPLFLAASHGRLDVVDLLLNEKEIDVAARYVRGDTALCVAARYSHEDVVKRISQDPRVRIGSDINDAIKVATSSSIKAFLQSELLRHNRMAMAKFVSGFGIARGYTR